MVFLAATKLVWGATSRYLKESTIGGLRNAAQAQSLVGSLYWIAIFSVGAVLTFVQIRDIVEDFSNYPVVTSIDLVYSPVVDFPAVTVCNLNRINCGNLMVVWQETQMKKDAAGRTQEKHSATILLEKLEAIMSQTGCDETLCTEVSNNMDVVRDVGQEEFDMFPLTMVALKCQNIFIDRSRQYMNHKTCYYLWQMQHYERAIDMNVTADLEVQNAWTLSNCTLRSACIHYELNIMGLDASGTFSRLYKAGDEIKNDCGPHINSSTTSTSNRRRRRKRETLLQVEQNDTIQKFQLEDDFLVKYLDLDESVRKSIGHRLTDYPMELWQVQWGLVHSCVFMGQDCQDEQFWHQSSLPNLGNCYTFNSVYSKSSSVRQATLTGSSNGLQLEMFVDQSSYMMQGLSERSGVKLIIQDASSTPLPDVGLILQPGTISDIALELNQYSRLPAPYTSQCINDWNETMLNCTYMLNNQPQYTLPVCQRFCIQVSIIESCGCYHTQLDMSLLNISNIEPNSSRPCSLLPETTNADYVCFQDVLQDYGLQKEMCSSCNPKCSQNEYSSTVTTASWPSDQYWKILAKELNYLSSDIYDPTIGPVIQKAVQSNYLKAEIYYQTLHVQVVSQAEKYTGGTLFSALGGALGFYLGIAIIMLFELMELAGSILVILFRQCKIGSRIAELRRS